MPAWFLILLVGALLLVVALTGGALRWSAQTRELHTRLDAARVTMPPDAVDFRALETLPAPVARYFRSALTDGQPLIAAVTVTHTGTFNMSETGAQWQSFTSSQAVITRRPGFVWDARIALLPAVAVRVHDAYVAGEGVLRASLFGLIPLAELHGGDALAQGELMRFAAEAAWYPTALLPGRGVEWQAVSERSARAALRDGDVVVSLLFTFGDDGLIDTIRADARGRVVGGGIVPTPWQGRFWNYIEREGMRIPQHGEVAWLPPGDPKPYWRGRIHELKYEFVR